MTPITSNRNLSKFIEKMPESHYLLQILPPKKSIKLEKLKSASFFYSLLFMDGTWGEFAYNEETGYFLFSYGYATCLEDSRDSYAGTYISLVQFDKHQNSWKPIYEISVLATANPEEKLHLQRITNQTKIAMRKIAPHLGSDKVLQVMQQVEKNGPMKIN